MPNNKQTEMLDSEMLNFDPRIIEILLLDRTTQKNIIWATDDYDHFGEFYKAECQITLDLVLADDNNIIKPRILKPQESQLNRTKGKAEVFTPSWMCNAQNNLVDGDWFGDGAGFNQEIHQGWVTNESPLMFQNPDRATWQKYVDAPRMELTCGEAPYLVSRYDTTTGKYIEIGDRIGLLDRKLRVVGENTQNESDWYRWAVRSYQSIYGFEYQGDNLILARENLLYTFIEYFTHRFHKAPSIPALQEISTIISWNIWQMDGLTFTAPYGDISAIEANQQLGLFQDEAGEAKYCNIKDWTAARQKKRSVIPYHSLIQKEGE